MCLRCDSGLEFGFVSGDKALLIQHNVSWVQRVPFITPIWSQLHAGGPNSASQGDHQWTFESRQAVAQTWRKQRPSIWGNLQEGLVVIFFSFLFFSFLFFSFLFSFLIFNVLERKKCFLIRWLGISLFVHLVLCRSTNSSMFELWFAVGGLDAVTHIIWSRFRRVCSRCMFSSIL